MQILDANPTLWTDQELEWVKPFTNAQLLGLGEAVHTSEGFYSAKVRLVKYLVEHHGYRALAFETPWGRAQSTVAFVEKNQGSIRDALNGLFGVWRATSVADLLIWLRDWNQKHPQDPVRFFGNDTQQPEWDLKCLLDSSIVGSGNKVKLKELLLAMYGKEILEEGLAHLPARKKIRSNGFAENQDKTSEITELLKSFSFKKNTHEYAACISLMADTLQFSKDVHGTLKDIVQLRAESYAHRDQVMSDLTLHFAGTDKTILWAHNLHICRPSEKLADGFFYQGQFLKSSLGENYKCIAISAVNMQINWPWLPEHTPGPVLSESSLESLATRRNPGKSIFMTTQEDYNATVYSLEFILDAKTDISANFDGLLILPESGPIKYAATTD